MARSNLSQNRCTIVLSLVGALTACSGGDARPLTPDAGIDDLVLRDAARPPPADVLVDAQPPTDSAAPSEAAVDPARFSTIEKALSAEQSALGAPGVAIAIVEKGQVTYAKGFGVKHPDRTEPVLDTTLFRIGSLTKVLTATAVMNLLDEGTVDLHKPVLTYTPKLRIGSDTSTLAKFTGAEILHQSAAISDYLEIDWANHSDSAIGYLETRPFGSFTYFMAPPGRFWNYSNPNFMVAGLLLERVTGTPYRTRVQSSVLLPLGMSRTHFTADEVKADGDFSYGKTVDWETGKGPIYVGPDSYDNPWARPAGYAWSSVRDIAKFAMFLMRGNTSVLSEGSRAALTSKQINTRILGDHLHYGYGLFVHEGTYLGNQFYDIRTVEHGGDIHGFAANMYVFPDQDLAVAILANADGAHFINTVRTVLETLGPVAQSRGPDIAFRTSDLDAYVGEYQDDFSAGRLVISKNGSRLEVSAPTLDAAGVRYDKTLACYVRDNCYMTLDSGDGSFEHAITFIRDADSPATYMRSRAFVAKRVVSGAAGVTPVLPAEHVRQWTKALRLMPKL